MKIKEKKNRTSFKQFINKGNILDLATGIIIGTAFTAIVNSLVNDIVMPFISRLINFDLTSAKWILREEVLDSDGEVLVSQISVNYGAFVQNVINFIIIAFAIYVAVCVVRGLKNSYIKSEVKYIKRLKEKHPEFFDEEDELGSKLYEKLKSEHPEHFKTEIALEIEEKKAKAKKELTPQEQTNLLLTQLNENLEKVYNLKEEKKEKTKDEQ